MYATSIWSILSALNYIVVLIVIESIIRNRRDPRSMIAWIFALLLLPFLGLVLYLLLGQAPIQRKVRRRKKRRDMIEPELKRQVAELHRAYDARAEEAIDEQQRGLMQQATRISSQVVARGNAVDVFHDPERTFLALSLAIEAAESHVNVQYYIFKTDETGQAMRDLLVEKARQGVEVRLLLDAVGCWKMPNRFVDSMKKAGVKVAFFMPWRPTRRRFFVNCRNHRKIAVVDGKIGFLGSQNIGDEYAGRKRKLGPWRDTHLRIRGPAVAQLQEVFVEDWHFVTREDLAEDRFFPPLRRHSGERVQIVASGPDRRPDVLHYLLFAALAEARDTVSFVTPYFVPDRAMLMMLKATAHRGVKVRLLMPQKSDHWFILWAARSYYAELIESGIEVYETAQWMLHSKVVAVDYRWAMVGSANMDERSFRINFEISSLLYSPGIAQALQADVDRLCDGAQRFRMRDVNRWGYGERMKCGLARMATPLL